MCFSMEMDLIAGTAITAIGVGAVRSVGDRRALPLAALPVAFGLHHMTEALIWADIEGHVPSAVGRPALWAYLLFAFGVLPWFTPIALRAIEADPRRRAAMANAAKFGAGVSGVLVASMLHGPVTATLDGHHLSYHVDLTLGGAVVAGYVLATCAPLLLSSHRFLVRYGLVNLPVIAGLAWLMSDGLISLWCAWAAATSIVIVAQLRTLPDQPQLRVGLADDRHPVEVAA